MKSLFFRDTRMAGLRIIAILISALCLSIAGSFEAVDASVKFERACKDSGKIERHVRKVLGRNLPRFQLRSFDTRSFMGSGGDAIEMLLPNKQNKLVRQKLQIRRNPGRADGLTTGFSKIGGRSKGRSKHLKVKLPREHNYFLGGCKKGNLTCGNLAVVGNAVEGFVIDKNVGFSFFEPVDMLLARHGVKKWRGDRNCHILYNANFHSAIPFPNKSSSTPAVGERGGIMQSHRQIVRRATRALERVGDMLIEPAQAMPYPTDLSIILDADAAFYSLSPSTWAARQLSVINGVRLIYWWLEPWSNNNWSIKLNVVGQEHWNPGYGPTTTNKDDLIEEINSLDYYMIKPPANDEVSYYFAGYDLSGGIAGVAYRRGLCDWALYDVTWGDQHWNRAWGQQVMDADSGYEFSTLYGRMVVAAHEIGHTLGAAHDDGCTGDGCCAAGLLSFLCGTSLLKSGAEGGVAPDFRQPFFNSTASESIKACVDDVY